MAAITAGGPGPPSCVPRTPVWLPCSRPAPSVTAALGAPRRGLIPGVALLTSLWCSALISPTAMRARSAASSNKLPATHWGDSRLDSEQMHIMNGESTGNHLVFMKKKLSWCLALMFVAGAAQAQLAGFLRAKAARIVDGQ